MEVSNVADIWPEFMARLQQAIYCNMATIDQQDRPRSRMMHPIWELAANNPTGWVISWPQTHKAKHLARNPYVSLAYIHDKTKPVYVDCHAEWVTDVDEQGRIWELHKQIPPPLGFDPEPHFGSITHQHYGLLKFTPWRIELGHLYGEALIWRPGG
jgi:general stress protein 26